MGEGVIALERRIFRKKRILLLVLAACVLEAVQSGRSIDRAASPAHDWVLTAGLFFSTWMVTALAIRTNVSKERFLFASLSVAGVLYTAIAVMLPPQQIVRILRWIILLMLVSATVSGIAILFGRGTPRGSPAA
jgi:hypothetical protein